MPEPVKGKTGWRFVDEAEPSIKRWWLSVAVFVPLRPLEEGEGRREAGIISDDLGVVRRVQALRRARGPKPGTVQVPVARHDVLAGIDDDDAIVELIADDRVALARPNRPGRKGR